MTAIAAIATTCIHDGCKNDGRHETRAGWVCGDHLTEPSAFTGVKTFTATKSTDRDQLGERVTDWLRMHPTVEIVDKVVTQSSDASYHCLTITLFTR